jgi:hypothetical protein
MPVRPPQIPRRFNRDKRQRRRVVLNPVPRSLGHMQVHRVLDKGVVTSTTSADGLYGFSVQYSELTELTSFSNLYDEYRIPRIEIQLVPCTQLSLPATSPAYSFAALMPDFDDDAVIGSWLTALNYNTCKVLIPGQSGQLVIQPKVRVGASGQETLVSCPWIDAANTNVKHFGWKICVKQSATTSVNSWYVFARLTVEFRMSR